jgi:23S rRNA pseudouridine1911/1915/1917 synthase
MQIKTEKEISLFELLREKFPETPLTRLKKWIKLGAVLQGNKVIDKADHILKSGESIEFNRPKIHFSPLAKRLPFDVVFEDEYLIAVIKPAGIITVKVAEEKDQSLYAILLDAVMDISKGKMQIHVVHRLDKEVSGIVLFAKSFEMKEMMRECWPTTRKTYSALVEGRPPAEIGRIDNWLAEGVGMKVYESKPGIGKQAISDYRIIRLLGPYTHVEISLVTGRKNQIRVHMAGLGCPIVGDRRYGSRERYRRQVRLFARYFSFVHPVTNQQINLEAPLPKNFLKLYPFHEI